MKYKNQSLNEIEKKKSEDNSKIKDKQKFKYAYFIIPYYKLKQLKVYLSPEYKGSDSLEKINDKSFEVGKGFLSTDVYRFRIMENSLMLEKGQIDYHIAVNIENENEKYQYIIKLNNLQMDYYEYNFEIKELGVLPLNNQKQFEIYLDILRNKFQKKQNSIENEDFILSTQSLFFGKDKKYSFLFYLSILIECFNTILINRHLLIFKPEKIMGLGKVDNKKLNQIKNILNILAKKPEKIHIENEKYRQKTIELFYSVVFYFNLHFQKEKVKDLFENEQYSESLYDNFIKFNNYYKGLILPKKVVSKLIKKTDDYNQVLNFITYLGNDVIQFLEVINEGKDFIIKLFKKEKIKIEKENNQVKDVGKKMVVPMIDIEKYIQPKKEDDIMQLNTLINELINYQQEYEISYIYISYSFFGKYIYLNIFDNFYNLALIKNIVENYKRFDKSFQCKDNLNELIHETGMHLIKKGLLKNIEVLEFIIADIYFHDENFVDRRSLDILKGIDIFSLEKNFFKTWKSINFYHIFKNNFNEFLKQIALLIKEIKDFGLLFSFYNFFQDVDYKYESIYCMQKRFAEIFDTYSNEKCVNLIDDIIKLIYYSDKKNVNLKQFLQENIQNLLDVEMVFEIYIKLYDEYKDLSKYIKEAIIKFFSTNNNNSHPSALLFLIKNCIKLGSDIFSNVNKLIIKEEDFFQLEENENLKFFKGLIKEKLLEKVSQLRGSSYISKAFIVISNLESKIEYFEIKFKTLNAYFPDEKNDKLEEILKDRLNYIYISEEDKANKYFVKLKQKIYEIKEKIKNLELVYRDFCEFFFTSHSEDIKKLNEMLTHLKMDSLNYFEKNCINDYNYYMKFLEDAQIRNIRKKSKFYIEILENERKFQNEENDIVHETEKKFNEFKVLFEKDGINKIKPKFLESYLSPFRNNEKNLKSDLESELKTLIDIFEIKEEINLTEIIEVIILVYSKKYFLDIAVKIYAFIEKIMKENFIENIKDIIKKLQENEDIDIINNCQNKLGNILSFINLSNISINLLNHNINKLKFDLEKNNNELYLNVQKLETIIKDKEKEINEEKKKKNDLIKKLNEITNISKNKNILELLEKKEEMANEIKIFKKIFPFECKIGDKIFTVTFMSSNEDILYSMICKNTDKFQRLEEAFYDKFPDYKKYNNIFLFHGKIIDKNKNLESNNINDNDIIFVKPKN